METLAYLHLALSYEAGASHSDIACSNSLLGETPANCTDRARTVSFSRLSLLATCAALSLFASTDRVWAALRQGDRSPQVRNIQVRLQQLGYFNARPTGYFGPITRASVLRFQRDSGLQADGVVGPQTQTVLQDNQSTSLARQILRRGDRGDAVRLLQERLGIVDIFHGAADGTFDAETELALKQFQQSRGLTVDGVAGAKTQAALPAIGGPYPDSPAIAQNSEVTYLGEGNQGPRVRSLQQRLRALGYYKGKVTGVFDGNTKEAVMRFQQAQGLRVDGVVGPRTFALLGSASPASRPSQSSQSPPAPTVTYLGEGSQGTGVRSLQQRLRTLGHYRGEITGTFDAATRRAVLSFQNAQGLRADGVVGPKTFAALGSVARAGRSSPPPQARQPSPPRPVAQGSTANNSLERDRVRELQQRLQERGFYDGAIDGIWGEQTQTALENAQRVYNVDAADVIDGNL